MTSLCDVPAEQRLLGALIAPGGDAWIARVLDHVDRDSFYRGPHGDVLDSVVDLWASGERPEMPAVAQRLRDAGMPEMAGEVGEWMTSSPHGSPLWDAQRVAQLAQRRAAAQAMWDAYTAACDETQDLAEAVDQARKALDEPAGSQPLDIVWRDRLDSLGDVSWLVDGRFAHGLSVILGKSGSHKTFVAIDVACCVASGARWFGHRVDGPAPVVYVLAEGIESAKARVAAWEADRDARADKLGIYPQALQLDEPRDQHRLVSTCRSIRPGLVVVDTYRRNTTGDESDSERAQALVRCLDRVRESCGASALVVHHTGATLENAHRARGSQVLYESADTVVGVERDAEHDRITLHNSPSSPIVGKQRSAAEWPPLDLYPRDRAEGRVLSTSPVDGSQQQAEPPDIGEPMTGMSIAQQYTNGDMATVKRWIERGVLERVRDGGSQARYVTPTASEVL